MIIVLAVIILGLIAVIICRPVWLSDNNDFLRHFVNHEYLNVLGVIFVISLASITQVHLKLNQIEEHRQQVCFGGTRKEIRQSAYFLIILFTLAFALVGAKPLICETQITTAILNAIAIFILVFYVLILLDITMAIFELKPNIQQPSQDNDASCKPD